MADRNHPKVLNEGANLELRTNVFLGTTEMGEAILRYLFKVGSPFAPELFDGGKLTGGRKTKFDDSDLPLPLRVWTHDRYSLGIIAERQHPVRSFLHVSATDFLMFDHLGLSVSLKWLSTGEYVQRFLRVAKDLYGIIQANSGYIQNEAHERVLGEILDRSGKQIDGSTHDGRPGWQTAQRAHGLTCPLSRKKDGKIEARLKDLSTINKELPLLALCLLAGAVCICFSSALSTLEKTYISESHFSR